MIVGFIINKTLNGKRYIPKDTKSAFCPKCGAKLLLNFENPDFKIKQSADLTLTADGFIIGTRKIKEVVEKHALPGLCFSEIRQSPGCFLVSSSRIVEFDSRRANTDFLDFCSECEQYESIVGTYPPFLKWTKTPLSSGFYRTDLSFASSYEKSPCLIASPDAKAILVANKLKGIDYEPIHSDIS